MHRQLMHNNLKVDVNGFGFGMLLQEYGRGHGIHHFALVSSIGALLKSHPYLSSRMECRPPRQVLNARDRRLHDVFYDSPDVEIVHLFRHSTLDSRILLHYMRKSGGSCLLVCIYLQNLSCGY